MIQSILGHKSTARDANQTELEWTNLCSGLAWNLTNSSQICTKLTKRGAKSKQTNSWTEFELAWFS